MSSAQHLREFVNERLTAAAEEIFGVLEKNIVEYEEEVDRQRRLLDIVWRPEIKLHRIELPQQHVCKEEEVLTDQQLWNQERNSSLDQEQPEPLQIKEEQEEICTSQEGEQLGLKQETETFMLTPHDEEPDHSEPEPDRDHQLLSDNCPVAESQDQEGGKHMDSGSTRNAESKTQKRHHKNRSHSKKVYNSVQYLREFVNERLTAAAEEIFGVLEKNIVEYEEEVDRQRRLLDIVWRPEIKLHRIELPQQHVCKEEEVLTDQQLWNQERNSSLDQEEPEPLQIKEEQEEICTSQEGEQLGLKQETETFMFIPEYEEPDHCEPKPDRDHQLLSDNCPVAESQDQEGGKHMDSGSTRNAESKTNKRHHKNRSHSKKVYNSSISKNNSNRHTGKMSLKCDTCGKAFKYQSEIQKHLRTHTGEKPYTCETCGKRLTSKKGLSIHMRTHTGEKPYSCDTCGKRFSTVSILKRHMITHRGEKPYSCETCGKRLSCKEGLLIHMRTHTGERPYSCETCGRTFVCSSTLRIHTRTHTGERPYFCETCGKTFVCSSIMKAHMITHTTEKPYPCNTCGKRFRYLKDLKKHRNVHGGLKAVHVQNTWQSFQTQEENGLM